MKTVLILLAIWLIVACATGEQPVSVEPDVPAVVADAPMAETDKPSTAQSQEAAGQPSDDQESGDSEAATTPAPAPPAESEQTEDPEPETTEAVVAVEAAPAEEEQQPESGTAAAGESDQPAAGPAAPAEDEPEEELEQPEVVFDSATVPMKEPGETADLEVAPQSIDLPDVVFEDPPPPLPDPLDSRQINTLIFSRIGPGLMPVHRTGSALYLLHDLDGNGYNDVFALAIRGDKREIAEFANINDYTRLYNSDRQGVKFYLRLFYQKDGTLMPGDLVSLGERFVVDSFAPQAIVLGANSPFAVSVVFTTLQGRAREWVLFTDAKPERFSMQERTGKLPRIEDIDGDGVIDVVMYEEAFEAGIGNETYMTWYKWDGSNYVKTKTVNIVRKLRRFLESVFELMGDGDWEQVVSVGLAEDSYTTPDVEAGSDLFRRVFTLAATGQAFRNTEIRLNEELYRAVYPEIRENPFSQRDSTGFFFPLTVRFETSSGRNHLYTARVYMNIDPFGDRQFFFGVN